MRNLTIKRTKSFVASLVKMKIYIEDPTSDEIVINNVRCRKIGDLKNGEEKTFQIDECSAKVFVIADKLSRNYCNEFYMLPEGQEDIFLSGKNIFNPAAGNAFRFDNNINEAVSDNRKLGTRKGLVVFLASFLAGLFIFFAGYNLIFNPVPKEKTFSSDEMTITLTNEFKKAEADGYIDVYDSKKIAVFSLKEEFALFDGLENYTPKQYCDMAIQNNNLESSKTKTSDGLTYFEYDAVNTDTNKTYHYFVYVYKTDDAFWMVQFALLKQNADKYAPKIAKYAKSIVFAD